ncbi:GNAT family N-acetyltransferase [Kitasatospora cinereorecta]|uniref:GNAT family N-acetyltransferase n=1 Tax=Streptomyces sp. NPDC025273 TaxID=3155251 RepID=UPI0033C542B6
MIEDSCHTVRVTARIMEQRGLTLTGRVELRHVDEEILQELLLVAVNDAVPGEVMPPVAGPPGWTTKRQEAFLAWHRVRRPGLAGPLHECTFAIINDGRIVGSARLARHDGQDVLETGMWLARSERGRGIGTATLRKLLDEAASAGARAVIAETTADNAAALAALRNNDARLTPHQDSTHVRAQLVLDETQPPSSASPNP